MGANGNNSEGPEVEWKQSLPPRDRIANTLGAFANGCGGSILVGVRDNGDAKGLDDPAAVRSELERVARERLFPPLELCFQRRELEGRKVLEAIVAPASRKPVRVLSPEERLIVYVRDGSASRPATRAEIRQLERGPARIRVDERMRRLLELVARNESPTPAEVARRSRLGQRMAKRLIYALVRAGLIGQRDGRRLWVTPLGHRRLKGS